MNHPTPPTAPTTLGRPAVCFVAAAFVFVALAAVGCQSTSPPGTVGDPYSRPLYPKIIAQQGLNKSLASGHPTVTRGDSGELKVTVPVRVLRDEEVKAQYRFIFFDKQHQPLRPQMDWQYKILPARTQVFLEGLALSREATDWRLEIRPTK